MRVVLPNGTAVQALNSMGTRVIYHEIFVLNEYFRHGITLAEGDTVIDAGANIGMFSMFVMDMLQDVTIYALEPVPSVYEVMVQNLQGSQENQRIIPLCVGVSDQRHTVEFSFTPHLTFATTAHPLDVQRAAQDETDLYTWARAIVADIAQIYDWPSAWTQAILTALQTPGLRTAALAALSMPAAWWGMKARRETRQVQCQLTTLSEILETHELQDIALVKLDVEGSELDALRGLQAEDWNKVRQFVVEVHDVDDRVVQITRLMQEHGFSVVQGQNDLEISDLLGISTLYARRTSRVV